MFFTRKTPTERQYLSSHGREDRGGEDNFSSTDSVSGDDLEAHYIKTEDSKKSTLRIKLADYAARGRKKSFLDWKSAQPRIVWISIYLMVLSAIIILYVYNIVNSNFIP